MLLFKKLLIDILLYGSEILGSIEKDKPERVQDTYIKWILKLVRQTPCYILFTVN